MIALGKYAVPENIRKLKPIGSIVKKIGNNYYVYEHSQKKEKNKWKTKSGKLIGRITEDNGFIPNTNCSVSEEISTLDFGQYAIVINNSKPTIERLLKYFNPIDAYSIYYVAIVHFVNGFVPLKDIHHYIEQSYISLKSSDISFSYYKLSQLLDALGRRQGKVFNFEQSLLDDSSKEIAIDGHDIKSTSHDNDLAEYGNKYSSFKDMQMNVLMAYDINTGLPLISRAYPGSILDKVSVRDLLEFNDYKNMLFIIDRGFYSKENIVLFSQNGNHYIIPLSQNLKEYKEVTETMDFHDVFVYEKDKKVTPIEYKEYANGDTKIIVYRDLTMNAKERSDYLKNLEQDPQKYSMEEYEKLKDFFGVIILQSNLEISSKEIYVYYKKRWTIETFFNYFKNRVDINNLGLSDYYATQGMCFIMLIVGLIYHDMKDVAKVIRGKSIDDLILETKFIKLNKKGTKWCVSNARKELQVLMGKLNVDLTSPLSK